MNITIYGLGYVGLVTATCLAEVGHHVLCIDIDQKKIARLKQGIVPIYEPGLSALLEKNIEQGGLCFTADFQEAIEHAKVQFIAVGTPPIPNGSVDTSYVFDVITIIGERMTTPKLIINKSTVPVGTGDQVKQRLTEILARRGVDIHVAVASNPEFLKEGAAITDFMKPDRIVIGTEEEDAKALLKEIYQPFNRNHDRMIFMDVKAAELTKYVANAMLATKISFINEMANLAEKVGVDIEQVRLGIGSDPRIGYDFIYPGCGYGGSCFPKDVSALVYTGAENDCDLQLLNAVQQVNFRQKHRLFEKIMAHFAGDLSNKVFALWGLAFKPNTDDVREASSQVIIECLLQAGATIQVYDPEAMVSFANQYDVLPPSLILMENKESALQNADALIICTEWQIFRAPDFDFIKKMLKQPVIFDGRNLYQPDLLKEMGFVYYGIGRGDKLEQVAAHGIS